MTEATIAAWVLEHRPFLLLLFSGIGWFILADAGLTAKPSRLMKAASAAVVMFALYELVAADMCPEWANGGWLGWVVYYGSGCWIPV